MDAILRIVFLLVMFFGLSPQPKSQPVLAGDYCFDFQAIDKGQYDIVNGFFAGDTLFADDRLAIELDSFATIFGLSAYGATRIVTSDFLQFGDDFDGNVLFSTNVNYNFHFSPIPGKPLKEISIDLWYGGGDVNFSINNEVIIKTDNLLNLPREPYPGVTLDLQADSDDTPYSARLVIRSDDGIKTLLLGGQEFAMDNLCVRFQKLCEIRDLIVEANLPCDSAGQFTVDLDMDFQAGLSDEFTVSANGVPVGIFNSSQLPLSDLGPFQTDVDGFVKFVVEEPLEGCIADFELGPIQCAPDTNCQIKNLRPVVNRCDVNGRFFIDLDFDFDNVADSFRVEVNGNTYGHFAYSGLPVSIGPFSDTADLDVNGQLDFQIQVWDLDAPDCIAAVDLIKTLDCGNLCNIGAIEIDTLICHEFSDTFDLVLDMDYTNALSDSFAVFVSGQLRGIFPFDSLPLTLEDIADIGGPIKPLSIVEYQDSSSIDSSWLCHNTIYFTPDCKNCFIKDLSVDVVDVNPATGAYTLQVNFQAANTVNDLYEVYVAGQLRGTFAFASLPLRLPLNCNLFADTVDITICENDNPDGCCATTTFVAPCVANPDCQIRNIRNEVFNCDGDSYDLLLDFDVINPTAASFIVEIDGDSVGTFLYAGLPVVIEGLIYPGDPKIDVTIIDSENPDCRNEVDIILSCFICGLDDLVAEATPCEPDGTFFIEVTFDLQVVRQGSFEVVVNGDVAGVFNYGNFPNPIVLGPYDGHVDQTYEIVIQDLIFGDCRLVTILDGPDCQGTQCDIRDLVAEATDCDNDDNFFIDINFEIDNGSDSFELVWTSSPVGNTTGMQWFAYADLPVRIGPFPGDGLTIYNIEITDKANRDCSASTIVRAPLCNQLCDIRDIEVITSPCHGDLFELSLDFIYQHTSDSFYIAPNNQGFSGGIYAYTDLPLYLGEFIGNGDAFVLQIADAGNITCHESYTFITPHCTTPCNITGVETQVTDCDANGQYFVELDFDIRNTSDSFYVRRVGSGNPYHTFAYTDLPVVLGPYDGDGIAWILEGFDQMNPLCTFRSRIDAPDCTPHCSIRDITIDLSDCDSAFQFYAVLNFAFSNNTSDSFTVSTVNIQLGTYAYADLPVRIGPLAGNGQRIGLLVSDAADPNCVEDISFVAPNCLPVCNIEDIQVDVSDCDNSGQFSIVIDFQYQHTSDSFFVGQANLNLGIFAYADLPLTLSGFVGNGGLLLLRVADAHNPDCRESINIVAPVCNTSCELFNASAIPDHCDGLNYNLKLDFDHLNTSDSFVVAGPAPFRGTYAYADLPINFEDVPGTGVSVRLVIEDQFKNDCREVVEFFAPDCVPRCAISDVTIDIGDCNNMGQFDITLYFQHQNTSDSFLVRGNGAFYGKYSYDDLPIQIGSFDGDGITIYELIIEDDNTNNTCAADASFGPVFCGDNCNIFDLQLEASDCDSAGQFFVDVSFQYANTSGSGFLIFVDGQAYGPYFLNSGQAVTMGPFDGDGVSVYNFLVLDFGNPLCSAYDEIGPVDCRPCDIDDLVTRNTDCDADGHFFVWLDFNAHQGGGSGFTVKGNGNVYGDFNYADLPVKVGPFDGDGQTVYELIVLDNDNSDCHAATTVGPVNCNSDHCRIYDVVAATTPCTANGIFFVDLRFHYQDVGSQGFTVRGNGRIYGRFQYNQQPIRLGPFVGDGVTVYEFAVIDNENPDCRNFTTVGPINCNLQGCVISDLTVQPLVCNPNGTYKVAIDFSVSNTTNPLFDVFTAGGIIGTFNLNQLPVIIDNFPPSGNAYDVLSVCINDNAGCCASRRFAAPNCIGDCIEFETLQDGTVTRGNSNINDTVTVEKDVVVTIDEFVTSISGIKKDSITADSADIYFDAAMGIALTTHNATARFDFPRIIIIPCAEVSIDYFQIGDENNISINGHPLRVFERFTDLPRNIAPGVRLAVFPVNPREGRIVLKGRIETIVIGGEALSLDNICFNPCLTPLAVWPGDANADNFVTHLDLLNIGLAYGNKDLARSDISYDWSGQPAEDWMMNFATSVNKKHADCNGDGIVNDLDVQAIEENYGKFRADMFIRRRPIPNVPGAPPLFIEFPEPGEVSAGIPFKAQVHFGTNDSPAYNAYGLSFTMRFDPDKLRIQNVLFPPGWFGEPSGDVLTLDRTFESMGIVHVTMVRNNHENVSGHGAILDFIGIIDIIAGRVTSVDIDITDVIAINYEEFQLSVGLPRNKLDLSTPVIEIQEGAITLYPNPVTDRLRIKNETKYNIEAIRLISMDGRIATRLDNTVTTVAMGSYPPGVYTIEIEINGKMYRQRILKQ